MSTKQEIIKQAYGELWDKVCDYADENGKVSMIIDNVFVTPNFKDLGFTREFVDESVMSWYDSDKNTHFWQLKSLKGIEDNNGWIKIESFNDLPKEKGTQHWVIVDGVGLCRNYNDNTLEFWKEVTHYKPIEKPKPPIY